MSTAAKLPATPLTPPPRATWGGGASAGPTSAVGPTLPPAATSTVRWLSSRSSRLNSPLPRCRRSTGRAPRPPTRPRSTPSALPTTGRSATRVRSPTRETSRGTESLVDASGNANTGTALGGVTLGASRAHDAGHFFGHLPQRLVGVGGDDQLVRRPRVGSPSSPGSRPTSTSGGTIIGFDNVQNNVNPGQSDRLLWMDNTGQLVWGVYNGGERRDHLPFRLQQRRMAHGGGRDRLVGAAALRGRHRGRHQRLCIPRRRTTRATGTSAGVTRRAAGPTHRPATTSPAP